jgi:NAD(P)-dependent dehydrogenase (short-subunit alcohol dehydrogenase family)
MTTQRVFITGAGRGIGLEVARQYAERGDRVLAGCRSIERAPGLRRLLDEHGNRLTVVPLEVTSDLSISGAVEQVKQEAEALDILINNAGISPGDVSQERPDGTQVFDAGPAMEMFQVNTVAPLRVAQSFVGLLKPGINPRIVNVSSGAGSLAYKTEGGLYSYSASKAALNMYTRALAWDLRDDGITVVALDPGWVKTELGGPDAPLLPPESARGILRVIDDLTLADTSKFFHYQGGEVPW